MHLRTIICPLFSSPRHLDSWRIWARLTHPGRQAAVKRAATRCDGFSRCCLVAVCSCVCVRLQFYVWYYHTLPLLLYLAPLPNALRLLLLVLIEYSWNVFPATATSSGQLERGEMGRGRGSPRLRAGCWPFDCLSHVLHSLCTPSLILCAGILIASHLTLLIALLFSTRLPKPPSTTPVQLRAGKKVQ